MRSRCLIFLVVLPLFVALGESSDLCPVNFDLLRKLLKEMEGRILREVVSTLLNLAQKLDQEVSKNLNKLESKIVESGIREQNTINELKKSVLTELQSGFRYVATDIDNNEKNVIERIKEFETKNERAESELVKGLKENISKLNSSLAGCSQIDSKIKEIGNQCTAWCEIEAKQAENRKKCEKAMAMTLTKIDSGFYYFHSSETSWSSARKFCRDKGMDLVSLQSKEQFDAFVQQNTKKDDKTNWFWVSASNIGQRKDEFVWTNGPEVEKSFWGPNQPDDHQGVGELCVGINPGFGKLYDIPCAGPWPFICQLAKQDQTCLD